MTSVRLPSAPPAVPPSGRIPIGPSNRQRTMLWTVAAFGVIYIGWGSTFLAVRIAVAALPPFFVGAARNIIAGAVLVGLGMAGGAARPTARTLARALAIGGLMFVANHGGISWASTRNPSGITALLVATIPLWIVVLDWARGRQRRPSPRTAWGLGLGFAGSALLLWPTDGAPRLDVAASLVTAGAAVSWAAGTLMARSSHLSDSVALATGLPMLLGGLALSAVSAAAGEGPRLAAGAIPGSAVAALLYLVVLGSLLGFSAYLYLLRTMPATRVATYAYVNPIVALALGASLAGEAVDAWTVVAAGVSLLGVYLSVSDR